MNPTHEGDSPSFDIDDGASAGESVQTPASPYDETVLELKTGARVVVPAFALDEEVTLGLRRPSDAQARALIQTLPRTDKVASSPYILTPHGTTFQEDVEVTLPIDKASDLQKLAVVWLEDENDKQWDYLGKPQLTDGKLATIRVKHFSVLMLVERGSTTSPGGDVGSPGDAPSTQQGVMIGSAGGSLESDGVSVQIPPGALAEDTELSLVLTYPELASLDAGLGFDSVAVELLPRGLRFAQPVTVRIPHEGFGYAVYALADESASYWKRGPDATLDSFAATFETRDFSFFVVVRKEPEFLYDYEVPIRLSGGRSTLAASSPVYDRGSAFWFEREEGLIKLWRLQLDAEPSPPSLIVSQPWSDSGLSSPQLWITENYLVWHISEGNRIVGLASVKKDGSGYRADLPNLSPTFTRGDELVVHDYAAEDGPTVLALSPESGTTTALPIALRDLARTPCLYDAANDTAGCTIGNLTIDGDGGGGVATFDFKTGQRTTLGRSQSLSVGLWGAASIRQNSTHWFTGTQPASVAIWPKSGGARQMVTLFLLQAPMFSVDEEAIYFCQRSSSDGNPLHRVTVSDSQRSQLVPGCQQVLGADDTYVYYLGGSSPDYHHVFYRVRTH